MKKVLLKLCLIAGVMSGYMAANAQAPVSPLHFGVIAPSTLSNWYTDYVGTRFAVTQPASIEGEKLHSSASGTGWGIVAAPPLNNVQLVKGAPDSSACNGLQNGQTPYPSLNGKIAFIYRGVCEFGFKALQAQNLGAVAVVIVNNQPNGVINMGGGANGASVTIPVYMITKTDGDAINARLNAGDTVKMSITPWGFNNQNDLGIIFNGGSMWHNYAIPSYELGTSNGNPLAYKSVDGAFVANFGLRNQYNVKLNTTVNFTPNGGSPSLQWKDSVHIDSFPAIDSIVVMYSNVFTDVHNTAKGRYDVTYNVTEANTDDFPGDNTSNYSFYTDDSVYSKGRYDFTNDKPLISAWYGSTGTTSFVWGPMYYVNTGGKYAGYTQFSMAATTSGILPQGQSVPVYLFQWSDTGVYQDTLMENTELNLVGVASKVFDGVTDSSEEIWKVEFTDINNPNVHPALNAQSWYWVAAEIPSGSFLGVDGQLDFYARSYGVYNYLGYKESYSPLWGSGDLSSLQTSAAALVAPFPFDRAICDSVAFGNQKSGLTVGISMSTTTIQNLYGSVKVNNVAAVSVDMNVYPNPASDVVNVSVSLPSTSKYVSYHVINAVGKFVATETHTNVQNDKYTLDTHNLPAGSYYVTVLADNNVIRTKKFVVIKN
jgi:hypothetical protein